MGCGCSCSKTKDTACAPDAALNAEQKQVLAAIEKIAAPCGSKEIVAETGLDAKAVSAKVAELKKKGLVDSPVRCKYGITAEGRSALKC